VRANAAAILSCCLMLWAPAGVSAAARSHASLADASALYNQGTDALVRGDLGAAVAFLHAAQRIEPRAGDIRVNLAIARSRAAEMHGNSGDDDGVEPESMLALSAAESWWLVAILVGLGSGAGAAGTLRRPARAWLWGGRLLLVGGLLLWVACLLRAREEGRHPEAVVVVPVLSVGPAPDERPRQPYILGAGEEVRLGRERSGLVEVRIGGNEVGWARRSGLWRVGDVAGYTSTLRTR